MTTTDWIRLDAEGSHGLFVRVDGHWRAVIVEPGREILPPGVTLDDLPPVPETEPYPDDVVMALRSIGPDLTLEHEVIPGGWWCCVHDHTRGERWSHRSQTLDGAIVGAVTAYRDARTDREVGSMTRCVPVHTDEGA
jgi:hypothetical protein